jgi:hypothetical protein
VNLFGGNKPSNRSMINIVNVTDASEG